MPAEVTINQTTLSLLQGDITLQATDAIVNAANPSLLGGGGVDGAIHRTGGRAILEECKAIVRSQGRLPTGKAVITTGGKLPARYIIHTVGPVWRGGSANEAALLTAAYHACLNLATEHHLASIAFPSQYGRVSLSRRGGRRGRGTGRSIVPHARADLAP